MVIVLIVFSAGKLPQIGGALGRSIREFRDATAGPDEKAAAEEARAQPEQQTAK